MNVLVLKLNRVRLNRFFVHMLLAVVLTQQHIVAVSLNVGWLSSGCMM